MNWVDFSIIGVALVFAFSGWKYGIFNTDFGTLGLIGGALIAINYHQSVADAIYPSGADWSGVVAFAAILAGTFLIMIVGGSILSGLIKILRMGWIDRPVGGILWAGSGAFLCFVVLSVAANMLAGTYQDAIDHSSLARFLG